MYFTPSTLLFKFNGFDQPAHQELFPDEICDAETSLGEWRDTSPLTDKNGIPLPDAEDGWGGVWGVSIDIPNFYSFSDENVVNSPEHHSTYVVRVAKREADNSAFSRSLGNKICSRARIIVRDTSSGEIIEQKRITHFIGSFFYQRTRARKEGVDNEIHILRNVVMPLLEENALVIELEVWHDYIELKEFHYPRNTLAKAALKLLASGEDADVSFIVGDTVIYAHKLILKLNAGLLHTFIDKTGDVSSPVKIEGTTAEIFRFVLTYIYGDDEPDPIFLVEQYEEIIDVADKYGIIGLKLQAEAAKICSLTIDSSASNELIEHLRFAYSKNCALLKEHLTSIYTSKFDDLVRSSSFDELAKSPDILRDLMIAVADYKEKSVLSGVSFLSARGYTVTEEKDRNDSTVNDLIGELIDLELDIDGTKETLIARLDEYYEEEAEEELCSSSSEDSSIDE